MMERRSLEIYQYNAFTDQPFGGNPAGVVLDGSSLDEEVMQRIATQLNLAETAYLVPPSTPAADVRLRWFTPGCEVTLCGHATIAIFTAAAERGLYPVEEGEERMLHVETLSGTLRIGIRRRDGAVRVSMQLPVPVFAPVQVDRADFAEVWGIAPDLMTGDIVRHTDLDYWYIPMRDLDALEALSLSSERLSRIDPRAAFAFFSGETVDAGSNWHLRFFAPFHGVPEDIVTGSAQGPMGALHCEQSKIFEPEGWSEFKGEQGDLLGRPGRVIVRVRHEKGAVSDLEIAGGAVPMLEGVIRI